MKDALIALFVGIAGSLFLLIVLIRRRKILKAGTKVDGIIFDIVYDTDSSSGVSYPVVRFVTEFKEWITERTNLGMTPGFYKRGQKVKIAYLSSDPKKFVIDSISQKVILYGMLFVFICSILGGTYLLLKPKT